MRERLPVYDLPFVPPDPWANVRVYLTVSTACFAYAIFAVNLLSPAECSGKALTPQCWAALADGVHLVR
jgi:hypothetical protein